MEAQLAGVTQTCTAAQTCVLEAANEIGHPTQADGLVDVVLTFTPPAGLLWAMGSPLDDESLEYAGGRFVTRHLDRGRDPWNMVRRVRELENVSSATGKPVINDEPVGADEQPRPGARLSDPIIFGVMGVLDAGFIAGGTFHCQACLYARVPGPVQQACARAYIEGSRLIPDDMAPTFANARWANSPVSDARFVESFGQPGIVRAYSFLTGNAGWTVVLGLTGDSGIVWGADWQPRAVVKDWGSAKVWGIRR